MSSDRTNTPAISALTVSTHCGTVATARSTGAAVALHRGVERPQPPKALHVYGSAMRVATWLRKVSAWAAMA